MATVSRKQRVGISCFIGVKSGLDYLKATRGVHLIKTTKTRLVLCENFHSLVKLKEIEGKRSPA